MMAANDILKLCEIFYSLQGETSLVGLPTVFIRLAGCNLSCSWCDTPYARNTDQSTEMSLAQVIEQARSYGCARYCITGGEPLLQKDTAALANALAACGEVSIETNGTLSIEKVSRTAAVVMDVKCPASGEYDRHLAENFGLLKQQDEVKFVIADQTDYQYALSVCRDHDLFKRTGVLFGPVEGRLTGERLAEWILADKLEVRYNVGLHRYLWPGQRKK